MSMRDVARTCAAVNVGTGSTAVVGANPSRISLFVANDSANVVYLGLSTAPGVAPTAVLNSGLRLAAGASWETSGYSGAIAGISTVASGVSVVEL